MGRRYYDPSTGRFLTRDPAQAGRNWYVYAASDPGRWVDPEGEWIDPSTALRIGAIAWYSWMTGPLMPPIWWNPHFSGSPQIGKPFEAAEYPSDPIGDPDPTVSAKVEREQELQNEMAQAAEEGEQAEQTLVTIEEWEIALEVVAVAAE